MSINDVTVSGGPEFCDDSANALVLKSVMVGEVGSKMVQNCVTSFTDDPKVFLADALRQVCCISSVKPKQMHSSLFLYKKQL